MIELRSFDSLGQVSRSWLNARQHFAFAGLGRPEHRPVAGLKVWNDDEFAPGGGFPLHKHKNMEIITYVRRGAITHEDDLGNRSRIEAGDVQVMSAGQGIRHSEMNHEPVPTSLYQIWIAPRIPGGPPRWETRRLQQAERADRLQILASGRADDNGALPIGADARLLAATLATGHRVTHPLPPGHSGYIVLSTGVLDVNGTRLAAGDGALLKKEPELSFVATEDAEFLLVELFPDTGETTGGALA